ncbi:MAG TPA: RluA family pseudouridine synthase, partial [Polyangia bacterium]|nr:RluA family pseudouridine synthase [Polyangia bacterium]
MTRVRVDEALAGDRVDHVVAEAVPGLGVAGARRLVAASGVRVDGRVARKGERVAAGQTVEIDAALAAGAGAATRVEADEAVAVSWLVVDDAFVAIDKPAGVPSHPLRAGERGTAANAIVARFPECATASP